MSFSPDFDAFARVYDSGKPQLVSTKLVADLETPVSAYLKLADGRANSFLLEIGRRRIGARPLFDHRLQAGRDLALPQGPGRDQPPRPQRRARPSRSSTAGRSRRCAS